MSRGLTAWAAVAVLAAGVAGAQETNGFRPEVEVSVDLVSAYVFRGTTYNSDPCLQPGVKATLGLLELGAWGNVDIGDYDNQLDDNNLSEVDLSLWCSLPIEAVDVALGFIEYTYPGGHTSDDREVCAEVGKDVGVELGLLACYGVGGAADKTAYGEVSAGREFLPIEDVDLGLNLGVTLGYLLPDEGPDGFPCWTASAGLRYGMVSCGVTYIGQIDEDVLPDYVPATDELDAELGYDTQVVGTVNVTATF
jgi:hypothetical protein